MLAQAAGGHVDDGDAAVHRRSKRRIPVSVVSEPGEWPAAEAKGRDVLAQGPKGAHVDLDGCRVLRSAIV